MPDAEVIGSKIRNIIVHDYARIEPDIVVGMLRKGMDDAKGFSREILLYPE